MRINKTCLLLTAGIMLSIMPAFADGNAFTPLNFDDTAYSVPNTAAKTSATKPAVSTTSANSSQGYVDTANTGSQTVTGNADLQGAIAKIDTALEDIRADQNVCKAKYADIDNQYKFIKNERSNMKKQVKKNDKRIKELTRAKTNLGKNVL